VGPAGRSSYRQALLVCLRSQRRTETPVFAFFEYLGQEDLFDPNKLRIVFGAFAFEVTLCGGYSTQRAN
jgi:hypothetical protein